MVKLSYDGYLRALISLLYTDKWMSSSALLVRRVREVLKEGSEELVELEYPLSSRERSIDFIATGIVIPSERRYQYMQSREEGQMVVRVSTHRGYNVSSSIEEDLAKFAEAIDGVPFVVNNELYDNIVYERGHVFLGNERTLENLIRSRELIAIYRRNELYVALNTRLIEREISRGGIRISEVSDVLGISRKSLENYLRGLGLIPIEKAEKIVTEYSADMVASVNYRILREIFKRKSSSRADMVGGGEGSLRVYKLNKTTVDYVVREFKPGEFSPPRFYVELRGIPSLRELKAKLLNAIKLARVYDTVLNVVASNTGDLEVVKEELRRELGETPQKHVSFSLSVQESVFQRSS
jgi:putative transcriptional regulator